MKPLQNAIAQANLLANRTRTPLNKAISQLNTQNKILTANLNRTIKRIKASGITSSNMANSLARATREITPISRQAVNVKVSILRSMPYQRLPDNYFSDIRKLGETSKSSKEQYEKFQRTTIIPVPLEKPISSLNKTAVEIHDATIIKSKPEMDLVELNNEKERKEKEILDMGKGKADFDRPGSPKVPTIPLATDELEGRKGISIGEKTVDHEKLTKARPVRIKNLNFAKAPRKPARFLPEERISKKVRISKEKKIVIERVDEITDKPVEPSIRPMKAVSRPTTPIVTALGILAGSSIATAKAMRPTKPKVEPGKRVMKRPEEIITTPDLTKIDKEKPITPGLEIPQKTIEEGIEEKGVPKLEKEPVDIITKEPEISVPTKKESGLFKKHTSWIPISAALGSMASLATSAVTTNIQARKRQISSTMEIKEMAKKPVKIIQPEGVEKGKVTIKTTRPPARKEIEGDLRERIKKGEMEEYDVDQVMTKPIPAMVPSAASLTLLSFIAKRSVTEETSLITPPSKPKPEMKTEDVMKFLTPTSTRRVTTSQTNLPRPTGIALKELTSVASETKKSVYIDRIQRTKSKAPVIRRLQRGQKKKRIATPIKVERKETEIMPVEDIRIKRDLLMEKESVGALELLGSAAVITAVSRAATIADIYSKTAGSKRMPEETMGLPKKLPVTKSVSISTFKPDIKPRYLHLDKEGVTPPPDISVSKFEEFEIKDKIGIFETTKGGVEALSLLESVATSTITPRPVQMKAAIEYDRRELGVVGLPTEEHLRLTERDAHEVSKTEKITTEKRLPVRLHRTREQRRISSKPITRFSAIPSISDAMSLIRRRQEQRLLQRVGLGNERGSESDKIPGELGTLESKVSGEQMFTRPSPGLLKIRSRQELMELQRRLDEGRFPKGAKRPLKTAELYQTKAPRSADFDWLPEGAPKKRDLKEEQIMSLEEEIQILKDRLLEMGIDREPPIRKLQEFVHDPNLQNQLKKLFYESWLENMDKELKRYGG